MRYKKFILPIFLVVQIIAVQALSLFPEWIETYYSNGIYAALAPMLRKAMGWIPFSLGDVLYFVLITLSLRWFWAHRKTWKAKWRDHLLAMTSVVSVFYFCFHVLWAMNYHRVPLYQKLDIGRQYTDADLLKFTQSLIKRANGLHTRIVHSDTAKVTFPYSRQQVFSMSLEGYRHLAQTHPYFAYTVPSNKTSLMSLPLTYMGFAGYLNPFTNESQVNSMLPMFNFPTTAAHEMAHQIGYASESEANFIGYMASVRNSNVYFQYSGYTYALKYCLRNWRIRDEKTFERLQSTVNPGILKNYEEARQFWEQYETFVETGFKIFYDNFLKFNRQKDGLESYSKFVDLLVNYHKVEEF